MLPKFQILSILLTLVAGLAVSPPPARGVSLDQAVVSALKNNFDPRAASFEIAKARGRLIQAGLWPNPELELNTTTDQTFRNEGERATSAGFQQAFPISGRIHFAKQVSRAVIFVGVDDRAVGIIAVADPI